MAKKLKLIDDKFHWDSSASNLKEFVSNALGLTGKWTSPGGEAKLFTSDGLNIKWHGKKSKRISLSGDPIKINDLSEVFKSMIKMSAESLSSETEVCNDFSIATEQEILTSFIVENSVHLVNDSTLVNDNTKLLDSGDLLSLNSIKPVDSNTSKETVNSSSLFSVNESTQDGNGKTNVVASDDLLPESILKSMDTRFCQTE